MDNLRTAMDKVSSNASISSALHGQFCKRLLELDPGQTAILSNGRVRLQ